MGRRRGRSCEGRACCGQRSSSARGARCGMSWIARPSGSASQSDPRAPRGRRRAPRGGRARRRASSVRWSSNATWSWPGSAALRRARASTARRCRRGTRARRRARARRARTGCTSAPRPRRGRATRRPTWSIRPRRIRRAAFQNHALRLVLGDRERDVERLGRDLELLARPGEVDVPLLDRVRQPAEPRDLDLDDVSRAHRPRVRRRAREHDVARLERDRPAEVGELVGDAEEQVVGGRLLDDVAVQVRAEREVGRVELARPARARGRAGRNPSWPLTRSIEPRSACRKSCMPTSFAQV